MPVSITVNGIQHSLDVDPRMPLLWAVRDHLRLTGTKYGCGIAQCGACTVHVNGEPRRACMTPIGSVEGQEVTTIEGLEGREAAAVQSAWTALDTPQCGYCQSGQVMAATALLQRNPAPSTQDIEAAMAGNICRCAAYVRIREAIRLAADELKEA